MKQYAKGNFTRFKEVEVDFAEDTNMPTTQQIPSDRLKQQNSLQFSLDTMRCVEKKRLTVIMNIAEQIICRPTSEELDSV